ncbi:uncharacterized protein [Palaemon carinicauda]|uniref:uncharacterized protein n=1 Tax=Palaemon carinicauda TaxID=392227 RepID=UPI0035B58ED8
MNLKDMSNFITSLTDTFQWLSLLKLVVLYSAIHKARLETPATPWTGPRDWPYVHQSSVWSSYSEDFGPSWYEDDLKMSPEETGKRHLTKTAITPLSLAPEEYQFPQTQNPFGQDAYKYADHPSTVIHSPHTNNPSPPISGIYNTSNVPSVTHSYFSLGDSSQWWYRGEDGVNHGMKDTSVRYRGTTKFKDSLKPRLYPEGSLTRPHRQKNHGAFVLGDSGYSVKSHQHDLGNENNRRLESSTELQIGTPVLQKESKDPIKKGMASAMKERKMYSEPTKNRKFTRKRKNLLRTKVIKKIKNKVSRSYRDGPDKLNIGSHGRRSLEPHPGFFRDYTPDCALHSNRTFCFMDETYPSSHIADLPSLPDQVRWYPLKHARNTPLTEVWD